MKVGIVCPYSLAVHGGVQSHVRALAAALRANGDEVHVLAPAAADSWATSSGRALAVPYNGSVARLAFGPLAYVRVRRWLAVHRFDVLHLHEPTAPSLSMLALLLAEGPIVATFHTSAPRSRALLAARPALRPLLEKVTARIAVSGHARRLQVEHLGLDAVEIGNGVDCGLFSGASTSDGATVGFAGRFSEPRKGFRVLLEAAELIDAERLLVIGTGDAAGALRFAGPRLGKRIEFLGAVDDRGKARALRSIDVFCAPALGGESFGMVLIEAMAAGCAVVASDLPAFREVLGDAGVLVAPDDRVALAAGISGLLTDPARRAELGERGRERAAAFDWSAVAAAVRRVYEVALEVGPPPVSRPLRRHVRIESARAGLHTALRRRALAAERAGLLFDAETSEAGTFEERANQLTRALAGVNRDALAGPVAAELTEAELRVALARRIYNDAVRDALLHKRSPGLDYFDIAEPEPHQSH